MQSKDTRSAVEVLASLGLKDQEKFITVMNELPDDFMVVIRNIKMLQEAQEVAKVGFWEWDVFNDKIIWSKELYHIFGVDEKSFDASFENYMSLIHPEDKGLVSDYINQAMESRQSYEFHHRIVTPTGGVKHILSKGSVISENDQVSRMFGTAQDISQWVLSENKFEALLESAPDAMIIVNGKGEMMLTNKQTETLFGYTKDELLGQKVEMLLPQKHRGSHETYRKGYNRKPREMGYGQVELWGLHKDKHEIPVEIRLSPIDSENEPLVCAAVRDISNRKEHEKRHKELYQLVKKSNKELENFAYVVSHDLKAPLRSISTVTDWIIEDLEKEGVKIEGRNWEIIKSQTEKMYDLIDAILEYSRIGRIVGDFKTTNLNGVVNSIFDMYLDKKNIQFKIEGELPMLSLEPTRIHQVFQNLISNAVEAINEKPGTITVSASETDTNYTFQVKDNGPGIEEKYFERIFMIFQSLTKKGGRSTGVGLTITKKVIESYEGEIWLESEVGSGTTFYFTIPKQIKTPTS